MSYLKYWGWARRPGVTSEIARDNPEEVIAWLVTEHIMDPTLKGVVVLLQTNPSVREVLRRIPADAEAWWECLPRAHPLRSTAGWSAPRARRAEAYTPRPGVSWRPRRF